MIDTHAHYDDKAYDDDRDELIGELPRAGIDCVINAAQDISSSRAIISMAEKYDYIYAAVGVHPHEAANVKDGDYEELYALTAPNSEARRFIKAIGETGLDYHYDFAPRDVQQQNFAVNIALAKERMLPLIVHDREAHEDTLSILDKENAFITKVVYHCYSGSAEYAREITRRGGYFSFGGAVTFKNAHRLREVVRTIPLERIMLETDCPYMTPEPHRGTRNDSRNMKYTAGVIAEIVGIETEQFIYAADHNAKRFFDI